MSEQIQLENVRITLIERYVMDYNQPKLFRQLLVWQYLHNYQYFVGQPFMQTWTSVFSQTRTE